MLVSTDSGDLQSATNADTEVCTTRLARGDRRQSTCGPSNGSKPLGGNRVGTSRSRCHDTDAPKKAGIVLFLWLYLAGGVVLGEMLVGITAPSVPLVIYGAVLCALGWYIKIRETSPDKVKT